MNIITFPAGIYSANTYFIENEQTKECIIVDPGGNFELIKSMVEEYELKPKHVLLTHGHFDHIGALNDVRAHYGADVYAHAECSRTIFDPLLNLSVMAGLPKQEQIKCDPVERTLADCQEVVLCDMRIKAVHCPGHSKGSAVYLLERCAFTGDVLFKMSIGRTDFLGSDPNAMTESLTRLKEIIEPSAKLLPGHGEETNMQYELDNNPFLTRL